MRFGNDFNAAALAVGERPTAPAPYGRLQGSGGQPPDHGTATTTVCIRERPYGCPTHDTTTACMPAATQPMPMTQPDYLGLMAMHGSTWATGSRAHARTSFSCEMSPTFISPSVEVPIVMEPVTACNPTREPRRTNAHKYCDPPLSCREYRLVSGPPWFLHGPTPSLP